MMITKTFLGKRRRGSTINNGNETSTLDLSPNPNETKMKIIEYDIDYESPEGIDNCMYKLKNLHDGLWNEYIDDPELLLKRDCLNIYNTNSTLNHLGHIDIFSAAEELFTPDQVIAIYRLSSVEARRIRCPMKRILMICDALDDADTLSKKNINDVTGIKKKINEMHPIIFLDFTDILYSSGVMRYLCPENNYKLRLFERKIQHVLQ